ncbi:response regulator [Azospirillum sp. ST 5-10]|uniref:response regulator n=1 Tax=unclassified Azospirillum TaxID=2630922 RepID=UPI003F4A280B
MTDTTPPTPDKDARASVLVVDDDQHTLFALEQTLTALDVEVIRAATGEEALRHILRREFALILLDVRLPDMDGYDVAALVRQRERNRNVPIIFLSGVNQDDIHLFRGYSAGAVDYILKPVDPVILRSKVAVFVELFNKNQELRRQVVLKQRLLDENIRINAERLMAEQALLRSEQRHSAIVRSLPIAIYSIDLSTGLAGPQFLGDMIERISGFPPERFAEDPGFWAERIHPDDRERAVAEKAAALARDVFSIEYRWACADECHRVILDQGAVLRSAGGGVQEMVGTWLDITERRHAEQQLAQVQKIDALGQLTGGIAHDFNNMLMVIINNLERVYQSVREDESLAQRIDFALQAATRCSDLTRQLLAFARRQSLRATPLDLNAVIADMLEMLRRTLEDEIEIVVEATGDLGTVVADRAQVESALLNLVVNARDAMPHGGRVVITTANLTIGGDGDDPDSFPEASPGDYVSFSVVDSGEGMPPDVRERAFEPFFTTKPLGRGTGLGLSIIYGFVKQSGGAIRIDSQEGRGTTVRVALPRAAADLGEPPVPATGERCPPARPGETVLLVEDDPGVRRVAVEQIGELGYRVIEAAGGAAALELLASGAAPDVLFTDIAMPGGMNGYDLAAAARARHPRLRVLYTSAYPEFALARNETARVAAPVLQKPYTRHELACALRAVLDRVDRELVAIDER